MIILAIIFAIVLGLIAYSIYEDGFKKGGIESLFLIVLALIGVIIERIIDKQFDSITFVICLITICLISFFIWLRKNILIEDDNKKKKSKSKKNRKRKKKK